MTYGSLQNLIAGSNPELIPTVGMGATEICWTDRNPFTVVEVKTNSKGAVVELVVQSDDYKRTDNYGMSESQRYEFTPNPEGHKVVVTKRNIPAGTALQADDLAIANIGGDVAPEGAFHDPSQLEGRVVTSGLAKGQPVMENLLAPLGTGSGLQAVVPKGMRAITLEVNEFSGVAGFLVPGCRVDVVSTISESGGDVVSRTIVQNVEVTALGRRQQANIDEAEQTKSVTLLVKPREAEAIELAAATGRPRLVLRSSGDKETAKSSGVTVAELRGGRKAVDPYANMPVQVYKPESPTTNPVDRAPVTPVVHQQPAPREHTVTVIRGGVASEVTMQFLADILGAPVDRPVVMETTALGAAFLAGFRAGVCPDPEGFAATWKLDRRFMPAMDNAARARKWAGWQAAIARVRTPLGS